MHVAGAQPGPASHSPEPGDDSETTHVPPSLQAAPETMCAAPAEEESHLESEADEATLPAVSEIEQTPEQPVKNRKQSTKCSGKANRKKGVIIPNTSKSNPERPVQQTLTIEPKGRSIQAGLATQFSELADEVRKTEEHKHTGE
jgi:hypothetical protein